MVRYFYAEQYSNTSVLTSRVNNIITHNNDTEGNSELIDIRKGADGTTYETAGDAVREQINDSKTPIEHYPFAEIPSNQYTYALINLKIISSTSDEIYIFRVARQAAISGNTVHSITLINGSGEQILALNVLSSQYTEVSPDTPVYFNKSGVEGYYNIDWDAIPVGTNAYNTNNNWKGAKINSLCMPNRLVTDTTLAKAGLSADSKTVGDSLSTLSKEVSSDRFILPSVVYGVVGKPFSIYYYNIFQIDSLDGYHVNVSPSSNAVENMGDRVRFSCTTDTTYNLSIDIRKNDNANIAHKTITVTILPNSVRNIKAIFIGDSFIADGRMVGELKSEFGNAMTLYGTIQKTVNDSQNNTVQIYTEGRGGWSLNDYLTWEEKNNVTNAFWNGTAFDFGYYIGQHNDFSDVTDVFILSGPNDFNADASTYGQRYAQIINSIRSYSNSIKIHCLMPLTCNCSGYAWGTRNYYSSDTFRYAMMSYGRKILELVEDYSNVSAVPMYVYFDKDYNFPTTQVAVNDRTPTLVTVFNDNVHPNGYGYYSMSDMIYADIIATT